MKQQAKSPVHITSCTGGWCRNTVIKLQAMLFSSCACLLFFCYNSRGLIRTTPHIDYPDTQMKPTKVTAIMTMSSIKLGVMEKPRLRTYVCLFSAKLSSFSEGSRSANANHSVSTEQCSFRNSQSSTHVRQKIFKIGCTLKTWPGWTTAMGLSGLVMQNTAVCSML